MTKLKAFADNDLKVAKMTILLFNPFPNKPLFLRVCSTSLLKTLWEKEKLLVTSNFSFSHSFLPVLENFRLFSLNLKLSAANSFSLEESEYCRWERVNRAENTVGKEENVSPFPTVFSKASSFRVFKSWDCVVKS